MKHKLSSKNDILNDSVNSYNTICPYADKCGGCKYINIPYEEELNIKQNFCESILGSYHKVNKIIGMNGSNGSYFYRNKVHHVLIQNKNNVLSGMYSENSHKIIPIKKCMLEDEISQRIISTICDLAKSFKINIYDENKEIGVLRHVLIRRGFATGNIMVVIVIATDVFPSKNNFVRQLRVLHPEISTVVININKRKDSMILGDKNIIAFGKGYIEDILCGLKFKISPSSFYQINSKQTEILYLTAMKMAANDKPIDFRFSVIDSYCGIGTIGLIAAKKFKNSSIVGIEINKSAIKDARYNSVENNIINTEFYAFDAAVLMEQLASSKQKCDILFMDPPRSGSDSRFINSVLKIKPETIVYISCNPLTLSRDLKMIVDGGYSVKEIQPVDMFPHTEHVETVVLLIDKKVNGHIDINLDVEKSLKESQAT